MIDKPFICLQTDFGIHWGAVSSMHGVIASIDPELRVNDISHLLPKFEPWAASYCLQYTIPNWPAGTIFVSVVDPGVGTRRRAALAKTGLGHYIITPDNGTLTHVKAVHGIEEVREIDEGFNRRPGSEKFYTFHGRDLFAYTAGRLAAGIITGEQVGPLYPVEEIVSFPLEAPAVSPGRIEGIIDNADHHFGSVSFNIDIETFERAGFKLGETLLARIMNKQKSIFSEPVLYHRSFGYVSFGEPILYNGSTGYISLGINQGNFTERYGIGSGNEWKILLYRP
jgi:S-adenosylmethionine hydrolase